MLWHWMSEITKNGMFLYDARPLLDRDKCDFSMDAISSPNFGLATDVLSSDVYCMSAPLSCSVGTDFVDLSIPICLSRK